MINSGVAPFLSGGGDGEEGETLERNLMEWNANDHWSVDNPNPNAAYPRLGISKTDINNNIQVFSPFKLWDPELAWNAYPFSRTFNLGVQFTF